MSRGQWGRCGSGICGLLLALKVMRSLESVKARYKSGIFEIFVTKEIVIRHVRWGSRPGTENLIGVDRSRQPLARDRARHGCDM